MSAPRESADRLLREAMPPGFMASLMEFAEGLERCRPDAALAVGPERSRLVSFPLGAWTATFRREPTEVEMLQARVKYLEGQVSALAADLARRSASTRPCGGCEGHGYPSPEAQEANTPCEVCGGVGRTT